MASTTYEQTPRYCYYYDRRAYPILWPRCVTILPTAAKWDIIVP